MFNTGSTTLGMPNWEEETGQGVVSQRDALTWSVNALFDSFSFLIDYVIYIPRQTQLLARRFTPFYTSTRPTGLPSSGEGHTEFCVPPAVTCEQVTASVSQMLRRDRKCRKCYVDLRRGMHRGM
jgi:hypothetical protein